MKSFKLAGILLVLFLLLASCGKKKPGPPKEVDEYNCSDDSRVIAKELVSVDKGVSSDGNGSIMIMTVQPVTVRFFESKLPGENCKYTYKLKMKSQDLKGDAYLTMDINYPSGGSQTVQMDSMDALIENNDWTPMEISISGPNQKPSSVVLSVVLSDEGTVWVDDIHLIATPLG